MWVVVRYREGRDGYVVAGPFVMAERAVAWLERLELRHDGWDLEVEVVD